MGAGYAPIAPGTAGAAVGALLLAAWTWVTGDPLPTLPLALACLISLLLGVWVTDQLEPQWGKDPSRVVIDEVLGMWITMLFVPLTALNLLLGFILFRLFGIWKPLGVRRLEAVPGGWGVMLDDLLAGIYANLSLQVLLYFL